MTTTIDGVRGLEAAAGPLGWAVVSSLWQAVLVAALYAAARALVPATRADVRYRLAALALLAMVALPAVTAWRAASSVPAVVAAGEHAAVDGAIAPPSTVVAAPSPPRSVVVPATSRGALPRLEPWLPAIAALWLVGVGVVSLLNLLGLRGARALVRRGTSPAPSPWPERAARIAARLGVRRPVALLGSTRARVPAVVGWLRPAVIVPIGAFSGMPPAQLEAILAHELAHVRRGDYLAAHLQALAETLLFYHPAAWWVSGEMRREREHCCDDLAVAVCGDRRVYAGALAGIAELRLRATAAPALGADGGSLLGRVRRLWAPTTPASRELRPAEAWLAGILAAALLATAVVAAVAALDADAAPAAGGPAVTAASSPATAPSLAPAPAPALALASAAAAAPADEASDGEREMTWRGEIDAAGDLELDLRVDRPRGNVMRSQNTFSRELFTGDLAGTFHLTRDAGRLTFEGGFDGTAPGARGRGDLRFAPDPTYVERMAALGWSDIAEEELFHAALFAVDVERARELRDLGYGPRELDFGDLLAWSIHEVTPRWIRELEPALGYRPEADDVLAFRIHGVDAAYLGSLAGLGLGELDADEALAFKIHGVDAAALRELESLGLGSFDADDAVAFRIHGVDAAGLEDLRAAGIEIADFDQALALRIHDVDGAYASEMAALDLGELDADELVALRIHGVTPDFVRELRDLGVHGIDADTAVALRIHDADAALVRRLHELGHRELDADDLVDAAIHGRRWIEPR